jgi:hypothetical protein
VPTSGGFTVWTLILDDGSIKQISLPGDGRISYGQSNHRTGATVRFYSTLGGKHYDAVITGVNDIFNHRVRIEDMGKTTAAKAAEEAREKWEKERSKETAKYLADRMLSGTYGSAVMEPWGTVTEEEEEPVAL